jgi:glucosamine 6-phosphate synthetase-like amidotransferase/phosphosugar isomerase protein
MCGVGGIIAPYSSPKWRARVMDRILVAASGRGTDATGICFVDPNRGMVIVKDGKKAYDFIREDKAYLEERKNFPAIVLGHARAATKRLNTGPENNINNHPFFAKESGIAMIHNGTMDNDDNWRDTVGQEGGLRNKPISLVDSEVMLCAVETYYLENPEGKRSMEDAIDHACYTMSGDYVLAFLKEDEPNTVRFVRHDNPLWHAWLPSEKAIVWGSTEEIIDAALTEYKEHMDYFVSTHQPKTIANEANEDTMIIMEVLPPDSDPPFKITTRDLDCAKSDSRARHYVTDPVPESVVD